jgi:hypothetical protein
MARRNREGEMRLGKTLVGGITLLEVVEVRMNEWMWMWMWVPGWGMGFEKLAI